MLERLHIGPMGHESQDVREEPHQTQYVANVFHSLRELLQLESPSPKQDSVSAAQQILEKSEWSFQILINQKYWHSGSARGKTL